MILGIFGIGGIIRPGLEIECFLYARFCRYLSELSGHVATVEVFLYIKYIYLVIYFVLLCLFF